MTRAGFTASMDLVERLRNTLIDRSELGGHRQRWQAHERALVRRCAASQRPSARRLIAPAASSSRRNTHRATRRSRPPRSVWVARRSRSCTPSRKMPVPTPTPTPTPTRTDRTIRLFPLRLPALLPPLRASSDAPSVHGLLAALDRRERSLRLSLLLSLSPSLSLLPPRSF